MRSRVPETSRRAAAAALPKAGVKRAARNDSIPAPPRTSQAYNPTMQTHSTTLISKTGAAAIGTLSTGALTLGALALGAFAIGAMAIGALAIRRLAIGKARVRDLHIDRLTVGHLDIQSTRTP